MSKNVDSAVVLSGLFNLFWWNLDVMLCHNLMTDDICKVNVTIKTHQVQKALLLMDLSQKNTRTSVECWDHGDKIKTIS